MIYKNVTRYITYTHSYNEVKMHSYKYSLLGVVAAVAMSLTAIAPASAEPIESSNPSSNSITLSAEDKMERAYCTYGSVKLGHNQNRKLEDQI